MSIVAILGLVFSTLICVQAIVTNRRLFYVVGLTAHLTNIATQLIAGNVWLLPFAISSIIQTVWGWTVMEARWARLQRPLAMSLFGVLVSLGALASAIWLGAEAHIPHMRWLIVAVFCSALSYVAPNITVMKTLQIVATAPWPIVYAVSGTPASSIGDGVKLMLLGWALFEIVRARRRGVDFTLIESAVLPWRLRKLGITTNKDNHTTSNNVKENAS